MSDLRDMRILAALARRRHFARAAQDCSISQPAFSARIRNLEQELGAPLVKRGARFIGFTREGEIALRWAHRILADADNLRQEVEAAKGALTGRLAVGAVPSALTYVARIPALLRPEYPALVFQIYSLSASEIHRGIDDRSLDAGVTYLDQSLPPGMAAEELYQEHYVLLVPRAMAPRRSGSATWAEAAALPLCLLTNNMRNREIINSVFRAAVGEEPTPVMETNAFTAALAQVASGAAATIAPQQLADHIPLTKTAVRLNLSKPDIGIPIGLVTADQDPAPPTARALRAILGHL